MPVQAGARLRSRAVGRPPTPTALKVLRGTAQHNPGRINRAEPHPTVGAAPPPWLPRSGPARRAWRRLAPVLTRMRVLTEADAEALALVCMALQEYLEARADAEGWRRADAAAKRYLTGLRAFGLTPADRARIATLPDEEKDPTQAWLEGSG